MFARFRRGSSSAVRSSSNADPLKTGGEEAADPSVRFGETEDSTKKPQKGGDGTKDKEGGGEAAEDGLKLVRRPSLARRLSNTFLRRKSSGTLLGRSNSRSNLFGETDGTEDGSVRTLLLTWGRNDYGQLLRMDNNNSSASAMNSGNDIPVGLTPEECKLVSLYATKEFDSEVSQYALGLFHSVINTSRGSTWGAGDNEDGQLQATKGADFTQGPKQLKASDALTSKSSSISVGLKHSAMVTSDGIVLTWGSNESGQLGHSKDPGTRLAPRQLDGTVRRERGVQVACSEGATFILTEKGQVWSTGEGARGELGRPESMETGCSWMASPVLYRLFCLPVTMIAAGAAHAVIITVTGKPYGWGWNRYGQLGFKSDGKRLEPSPVPLPLPEGEGEVKWASCGTSHTALLAGSDGRVLTAGSNDHGQLGRVVDDSNGSSDGAGFRVVTSLQHKVVKVECGSYHTLALTENGSVYAWGSNEFGEVEPERIASVHIVSSPVQLVARYAVDIGAGGNSTAVLLLKPTSDNEAEQLKRHRRMMYGRLDSRPRMHELDANTLIRLAMEVQQTNSLGGLKGALLELHATGLNRSFLCSSTTTNQSRVDVEGVEMALGEMWQVMSKKKDGEKHFTQRMSQLHHELLDLAAVATEPDQLRAFFIALLNPACEHLPSTVYATLVKATASLKDESLDLLAQWSVRDLSPDRFNDRLLKQLIRVVEFAAEKLDWSSRGCAPAAVRILSRLHEHSRQVSPGGFVSFDKFYVHQPNKWAHHVIIHEWQRYTHRDRQRNAPRPSGGGGGSPSPSSSSWDSTSFSLFDHPFVLSAETKRNIMMYDQQNLQLKNAVITALSQNGSPFFEISVRRDHILEDALNVLLRAKKNDLTKPLRVAFENEPGLDWGGVRKEFFDLLSAELFNPENQDMFCHPDPDNNPTLLWLKARGETARLVAQAERVQARRTQRLIRNGTIRGGNEAVGHVMFVADSFNCPQKCANGLQLFVTPHDGYTCDVCGTDLPSAAHVFSCRTCNYDVCGACREEEDIPEVTAAWRRVVLVGALMGLAVYNSTLLDVHFPLALYARLLDQPVKQATLDNLKLIDSSLARGLQAMLDFPADDAEMFNDIYGDQRFFIEDLRVDLVENGRDVPVTLENRALYVKRRCEFEVWEGVAPLLRALMTGFKSVVDVHGDAMSLFSPPELELMIVGVPDLDFAALEKVSKYEGGFSEKSPVVKWFWDICKNELDEQQQRQLLMFVTGAARAPIGGLAVQSFLIQRAGPDSDQLPTAHTCFNTLLLPDYSTKDKLKEKLRVSLLNAQGFGLQ